MSTPLTSSLLSFDKYIVAFSGGKDSTASFLYLLEQGVPVEKIELWHHDIDGASEVFMDWEVTPAYCRAFAKAFGVPIYFSWKKGGFKREMLRNNERTAPTVFQVPKEEFLSSTATSIQKDGEYFLEVGGTGGKEGTRMKFPQVSPDLSVRWCSAYLKIDICATAIRNQERFNGLRTMVISGERGQESPARAKYETWEADRSDLRDGKKFQRFVERHRPIKEWKEEEVWAIIERHKIRVHPAYYLGFGRLSCRFCIFGNANQLASAYHIAPKQGEEIIAFEEQFGKTIKRDGTLREYINRGKLYDMDPETIEASRAHSYDLPIFFQEEEKWILPSGAFGDGCGPA